MQDWLPIHFRVTKNTNEMEPRPGDDAAEPSDAGQGVRALFIAVDGAAFPIRNYIRRSATGRRRRLFSTARPRRKKTPMRATPPMDIAVRGQNATGPSLRKLSRREGAGLRSARDQAPQRSPPRAPARSGYRLRPPFFARGRLAEVSGPSFAKGRISPRPDAHSARSSRGCHSRSSCAN